MEVHRTAAAGEGAGAEAKRDATIKVQAPGVALHLPFENPDCPTAGGRGKGKRVHVADDDLTWDMKEGDDWWSKLLRSSSCMSFPCSPATLSYL